MIVSYCLADCKRKDKTMTEREHLCELRNREDGWSRYFTARDAYDVQLAKCREAGSTAADYVELRHRLETVNQLLGLR